MRSFLLSLVFALSFAGLAQAQNAEIEGVIGAQIEAFQADDFEQAFTYASPTIRGIFGTSDRFGAMVRNGYPMVWDNSDVRFLEQEQFESRTRQEVLIKGPDGAFYILDYQMIETSQGWQINGVQVIPAPEVFS